MIDQAATEVRATLAELRDPQTLTRGLTAGLLLVVLEFVMIASFAALIYSDAAPGHLTQAIGLMVVGDAVIITIVALLSAFKATIAVGQEVPAAVFGITAVGVAAAIGSSAPAESTFATVVVMVALTTVLSGAFFILLGAFKVGDLIRFLPYPVMGGFLAGTGILLVEGGIHIVTESHGRELFTPESLLQWLPAMVLGLLLFTVSRRTTNPLGLPIVVVAAAAIFYVVALAKGSSPAALAAQGWLVGGPNSSAVWQFPLSPDLLSQVDWQAIVSQVPVLAPMILISAIALLLNANGLELMVKRDFDLNHELVITGIGNMVSALMGGIIGFHSVSLSGLNHSLVGNRRVSALVLSVLLLAVIFLGGSLIGFIPKFVLGGLVIFVGFLLLADWIYDAWFNFPHSEFLIIILIMGVIVWKGFVVGVLVGLAAALLMFVFNYSRTAVIRDSISGTDYSSRVTRSPEPRAALAELNKQIVILRLQGFIFFGTANSLFETVRDHVHETEGDALRTRYVILDFTNIIGLDSTALLSFKKMRQLAESKGIMLLFTGMSVRVRDHIMRGGYTEAGAVRFFDTLDQGVEWCEEQLLAERTDMPPPLDSLDAQLQYILPGEATSRVVSHLTRRETKAGDYLMRQGDAPDYMYFIESGQITAQLESAQGPPTRLETMQGGRVVGELGFYLDLPRTAAIVVDQAGVVYSLSRDQLKRMHAEDPEAASALEQIIIRLLGERLVYMTRSFQAMQD